MSRLIDADALKCVMIETLERIKANPKMDTQEMHILAAFHAVGLMIDDAPTVDAVQIVRCGECKYFVQKQGNIGECSALLSGKFTGRYWFCADGERREIMIYPQIDGITPCVVDGERREE